MIIAFAATPAATRIPLVKATLAIGLHQSLKLTPQLQLAIRLLAMSTLELEAEINQMIEANPLLERPEDAPADDDLAADAGPDEPADAATIEVDAEGSEAEAEAADLIDDSLDLTGFDEAADWAEPRAGSADSNEDSPWEERTALRFDLREDLRQQMRLLPLSDRDQAIACVLIDAIDDNGYLGETVATVQRALLPEWSVSAEEIEVVLALLQHCHPTGIGARSLSECLCLQLREHAGDPAEALARILVERHLEDLARLQGAKLAARLLVSETELLAAMALIRRLNPRPGERTGSNDDDYIVPDLISRKTNGRWRLQLAAHARSNVSISRQYEQMAAQVKGEAGQYLRGRLQEARWLLKSLAQRGDTLLRVGEAILREQGAFLDYGPVALRPLTLRQLAAELGLHESTVSRATTRKYIATPRGVFELKFFFSSGVATSEGGEASAVAIKSMIRKLIDVEDGKRPLSDQALATQLNRDGIAIARRTVAKYREAMNIPASSDRCRME